MNEDNRRALAHMEQDSLALGCGDYESKLECEYGSVGNVGFAKATLCDSAGEPILCACGEPAGCAVIGQNAYAAWCEKCSPVEKYEAKLVYKPPKDVENYIKDSWTIKLEEAKENIGTTD